METIVIHVDSRFRNKTTHANPGKFCVELDNPLKNIKSIRLSSIEFPNVAYEFREVKKNNYFRVNGIKVSISDGNYTPEQIISAINTSMSIALGSGDISLFFSRITGHVTINSASDTNFNLNFEKDTSTPYPSLGHYLGFRETIINNISTYKTNSVIQTIGENYVFLKVNDYGRVGTNLNDNYVMAKIIVNKYKNCMVFDDYANYITKEHEFYQPININKLYIELIDSYGKTIDMNFVDFSLTLEVTHIYNSFVKEKAQKYIF